MDMRRKTKEVLAQCDLVEGADTCPDTFVSNVHL